MLYIQICIKCYFK